MKKIMCFTHWDLDGVVSYLVLRWTFPKAKIEYMATTVQNFRTGYTKWLSNHDLEDYDKVFIMDLGIYEEKDLIDYPNVFIIDHHPGHDNTTYKNAKSVIKKEFNSACMLAFKLFKKLYNIKPTREQVHLLALADDLDCWELKYPDSIKLNTIFWETNDKFESFIKSFLGGFHGFSDKQYNIISLHNMGVEKIRAEAEVYAGKATIQGKEWYVCSIFASKYINEVADILIHEYNAEISLVINPGTNHVSYRKSKNCDVDLSKLAFDLAGGAGHEVSSGSPITDDFMDFTKQLEKI